MAQIPYNMYPIRIVTSTQPTPFSYNKKLLYYAYPMTQITSFHLIAEKHIQLISDKYNVQHIDEKAFMNFIPTAQAPTILHPTMYLLEKAISKFRRGLYDELIGFDVCDSDRMSEYATFFLNLMDKVAVPSTYCKSVYERSGVRGRIYWIPHGLNKEWYERQNVWLTPQNGNIDKQLADIHNYKMMTGKKMLLFWLWHSPERKGWDEVAQVFKLLKLRRNDVFLVVKTTQYNKEPDQLGGLDVFKVTNWLNEHNKMALYDLADINLNFSRGGGFEINCLEALGRGVPCVSSDYGSWLDYEHPRFLIRRDRRVQPLPGNAYHTGYGYTVNVEDAVEKINDILDNLDEYKAIANEHKQKLKETFTWDRIGEMILKMIEDKN